MEKIDLNNIHSPEDIKGMDLTQLNDLAELLRAVFLKKVSSTGGHIGPNLGVVEATVALHYVFDAPKDKLVFDVSHQTYIHKMLTGRMEAFTDPAKWGTVTGYTCPAESEYDLFEVGHTSTSISLATGLAKARDLSGGKENVVAFIGDASMGGGMAHEGLDYAPELGSNIIVVLNDNQMSIAEDHGALYNQLKELRDSNGTAPDNIFKALGYEYIYVAEGNDIKKLVEAFRSAKGKDHAVLVHINTMKGKGLPVAEADKEEFHWSVPFDLKSGAPLHPDDSEDYTDIFAHAMSEAVRRDPLVTVLTAGTPGALGFTKARRTALGKNFVDVGIAEQNAVTVSAGLAKGGAKPVMGVMSTFLQRAYDQLSHDVAINDLPAVFVIFGGGVSGIPDMTHLGFFDIAMISNIPNIVYLAATCEEDYKEMIAWALRQREHPVVVRTPGGNICHSDCETDPDFTRYQIVKEGYDADHKVVIIGVGTMLPTALEAASLMKEKGVDATVVNPRILSTLDTRILDRFRDYDLLITIEDGILDGGFGQKVASYLGHAAVKVVNLGLKKEFLDRYNAKEVLEANGMTPAQIADLVEKA